MVIAAFSKVEESRQIACLWPCALVDDERRALNLLDAVQS